MKRYGNIIFLVLVMVCIVGLSPKGIARIAELSEVRETVNEEKKQLIVIDPGHGGFDPGKVGVNDALEKDINLSIAFKLKNVLEEKGYEVILTRTQDVSLNAANDKNKKSADMKERVRIINEAKPVVAISIHQNSYPQESVKGAQVFYHQQSEQGKKLAESIQEQMKQTINDGNHRMAKGNDSYYMLKKTECPIVIVECGFLSNQQEAALLLEEAYQEKIAWGILTGIQEYIDGSQQVR